MRELLEQLLRASDVPNPDRAEFLWAEYRLEDKGRQERLAFLIQTAAAGGRQFAATVASERGRFSAAGSSLGRSLVLDGTGTHPSAWRTGSSTSPSVVASVSSR